MHILIDAHLAVKEIDGVTRYLIGLLTELPPIDRSIKYTVLSLPDEKSGLPKSIFAQPNVRQMVVHLWGPTPKQHFMLPRLVRDLKADLYHHPQFDLPRGMRVPTVATVHDLTYVFHPEFFATASRLKRFYIKQSLKYTVRQADRIIAVSENTAKDLKQLYDFDESRLRVIHNGVTLPDSNQNRNGYRSTNFSGDYILFVGTRRPHKNICGLIEALAILRRQKNCNLSLVVAGKPYVNFRDPEATAEKLGLKPYVHFLDFVPDDQLPSLYHRAKAVVLPSFYEGFGFPVLEAMAYGKPVIASTVSSLPEVVGDSGLLVDPHSAEEIAEKIEIVVTNNGLAEQLSQKARRRAELFSWQKMSESTLQVYLEAINNASEKD
jgi:glycosyltransferase involved in cell wall biosynthesis